jgi:lysophospholipase L1-like esterase
MTAAYRAGRPIPVGLGLVYLASTHPGAELALDLRQPQGAGLYQQLALRYTPASTDTTVAIEAGGTVQRVRLPAWQVGASPIAEVLIRSPAPLNTVRIRVLAGTLYVQGLVGILKVPATSIVLDDFAVSSATAKGWMQADPATLAAALTGTSYDMIVLAYGTNEAADSDFTPARYAADLQQTLEHMRTLFPTQTCMLIGPPDRGVLWSSDPTQSRKEPYFYARRHREVAQIQQQLAPRYNCGFWDWQGAMGGAGVSYRWSKNSPAYMQGDLTHLTPLGYRWSAQAFARFLRWYP